MCLNCMGAIIRVLWLSYQLRSTLKGNATVKHVLTDGVKNHIFTLVTPKWPLTQWLLREVCWAWFGDYCGKIQLNSDKVRQSYIIKTKWGLTLQRVVVLTLRYRQHVIIADINMLSITKS